MFDRALLDQKTEEILSQQLGQIRRHTDRIFAALFVLQWIVAVCCAALVSLDPSAGVLGEPATRIGAAVVVGGLLSLPPIVLALAHPGRFSTRVVVAAAQMLYSGLLIQLTGGRSEPHLHLFASLAMLAMYRDCWLFLPAALAALADHFLRESLFAQSSFGMLLPAPWHKLEIAGWVLLEIAFLTRACAAATRHMRLVARTQVETEESHLIVEKRVAQRTRELQDEINRRKDLELQLLQAQKLESIGQLAAGIAHEINTPMQFLSDNIEFLSDCSQRLFEVVDAYHENLFVEGQQKSWADRKQQLSDLIERNRFEAIRSEVPKAIAESHDGIQRVIHIVRAMKEFSHPGVVQKVGVDLNNAVSCAVTISRNRWKYVADLELDLDPDLPTLNCLPADINQVLLNLIVNAADAIAEKVGENSGEKGQIKVRTGTDGENIIVEVEDTGCGIPREIRNRIFDPFFTTKEVGKGTGQGLAICYNVVVNKHQGEIEVISTPGVGTLFRVLLPRTSPSDADINIDVAGLAETNEPILSGL